MGGIGAVSTLCVGIIALFFFFFFQMTQTRMMITIKPPQQPNAIYVVELKCDESEDISKTRNI